MGKNANFDTHVFKKDSLSNCKLHEEKIMNMPYY